MAVLTCTQEQYSNCEGRCQTKVFPLRRNLNTDLSVFIKLRFLRVLNSSQSFQETVMMCSSCIYTIWERKKNWIQLYKNLFQYLSLHRLFNLVHGKLRWGEHVYLVTSGGARNYLVYDLLNFCEEHGLPCTRVYVCFSLVQSTCGKRKLVFARF